MEVPIKETNRHLDLVKTGSWYGPKNGHSIDMSLVKSGVKKIDRVYQGGGNPSGGRREAWGARLWTPTSFSLDRAALARNITGMTNAKPII